MFRFTCLVLLLPYIFGIQGGQEEGVAQIVNYVFNRLASGNYQWGFSTTGGIRREEEGIIESPNTEAENLVVRGSYSYADPNGKMINVKYTADKNGFHPEGDNIAVPPFVIRDNIKEAEQNINRIAESSKTVQQWYHGPVDNDVSSYKHNHFNTNYGLTASQLLNQQNQDVLYKQQEIPVQSDNNNYNYDKTLIDILSNSQNNVNYNQQERSQRPIIAIVGDDGKIIESSLGNDNIPDSILQLLGKSATESFSKQPQQNTRDENGLFEMIEKSLVDISKLDAKAKSDSAAEASATVNKVGLSTSDTNKNSSDDYPKNSTKV